MSKYQGIAIVDDPLFGISPVFYKSEHEHIYKMCVIAGTVKGPKDMEVIESVWLEKPVDFKTIEDMGWKMSKSEKSRNYPDFDLGKIYLN